MTQRLRNWFFTFNNYTEDDFGNLQHNFQVEGATYYVIGREVGKEGTPHLQGYVRFTNARALTAMKNKFGKTIHWEKAKTDDAAITYCKKENNFVEWGEPPVGSGARTDLKAITSRITEGASNKEILTEYGDKALRIMNHVNNVRSIMMEEKRDWIMDVRIYIGPPGSGKTRSVWEEFGVSNVYPKMVGKWWDGYKGERCVLIDDFDPASCFDTTYDFYLKLLDRYPMRIEWKGGSGEFFSKVIIFTSNFHPDDWFIGRPNKSAFMRRVTLVRNFVTPDTDTEVEGGNTRPPQQTLAVNTIINNEPTWTGV